ncbi:MAG TPA: pitrilysin family protein, partial [Rhodothermales bacterium]|nr:pitrilysin family protein [Rhodothermales bacterium]
MLRSLRLLALTALLLPVRLGLAQPAPPDVPYSMFKLPNGLTVIVHEDRKVPIVAVNLWYHVGSKNEPDGRSGFAHLFEHLMFQGSENFRGEYISALEAVGATNLNGTTNFDRTNYFQNVPTSALDRALFLESDRMGHLLGTLTQELLDEQRGVVQNEKRQGENAPYGQTFNLITRAVWPRGHPYDHTVIGSMEDLNAATLDDVKDWFRTYYGPSNAVLVLAGDIDEATAREKATRYFGSFLPGPPVAKFERWIAKRTGEQRQTLYDRVPQARVQMVFNVPEIYSREADLLGLAAAVLGQGRNSRLSTRLVFNDALATSATASNGVSEIAGLFTLTATVRPGQSVEAAERALREELSRFLAEGPTASELERVKATAAASLIRGIERIGGFGGKSDLLAQSMTFGGSPDAWKGTWRNQQGATPDQVRDVARAWLSDGAYVLTVLPFAAATPTTADVDRSRLPDVGTPPAARFPALQRVTLGNGLKVVLAERRGIPLVSMSLVVEGGGTSDPAGKAGRASLAADMLDEGTATRTALQLTDELARLGASLSTSAGADEAFVSLSALKANLEPSLRLMADVVLNPAFKPEDLERLRRTTLASIQQQKASPQGVAFRLMPALLYGEGHPYAIPTSGTETTVGALTQDDLVAYHRAHFKPNNATLVVAGDVTMAELRPLLESAFGSWTRGEAPRRVETRPPARRTSNAIYLVDRPGAQQSVILAGQFVPPVTDPNDIALQVLSDLFGGSFSSRLNMNLREDKRWSYGAGAVMMGNRGERPYFASAPVQTDKTAESFAEVLKEFREIRATRPPSAEEVTQAHNNLTLSQAGIFETVGSVQSGVSNIVRNGL